MTLQQLLPNLYWFADTCNVYLLKDGPHALLFDFGSGAILDHLHEAGIEQVDWVLHTHHHRDQCQGDYLLAERSIPIAVPEAEAALFEATDAFWRLKRIYHNYDVSSIGFTLPRPVPVAKRLADYERFEWRGHTIQVLPTPGHTKGSVSFLLEMDGRTVAVVGDLIAEPGAVHTIHDLQWQYGFPDGVGAALHSTLLVRSKRPDLVLGSHGRPLAADASGGLDQLAVDATAGLDQLAVDASAGLEALAVDASAGLDQLAANLRRLYEAQRELRASRVWTLWPHAVDQPKQQLLPHLWSNPHACSNVYALLSDDGRGILLDYGFPSWDHFAADLRFVEHSLDDLKAVAGLTEVEAVIPSHYHDDHLAGVPFLQQEHGVQAWIFENFADLVENPAGYNVPCLLPTPIRVDRTLKDGETFTWEEHRFTVFHMPGHTWWALGMFGQIDGTRVAYTGDNLLAGTISPLRAAAPVYRNKMLVDSIALGAERLREHEPELILTGHTGAIEVDRRILDDFIAWARELSDAFVKLVAIPDEVNFALDPGWCTLYPYRSTVRAGQRLLLDLRATNHAPRDAILRASLALPDGWTATPSESEVPIFGGQSGELTFAVTVPADASGRHVLCADVTLGAVGRPKEGPHGRADRRFGWAAEALVDVTPP